MVRKSLTSWLFLLTISYLAKSEASELPLLNYTVRHSYGNMGGYSIPPQIGTTTIINLAKITKKGATNGRIEFAPEVYVPFGDAFQLKNKNYYSDGVLSSHQFRSKYTAHSSMVLGIHYGVSGPYDARATLSHESNEILGVVFFDCNVV